MIAKNNKVTRPSITLFSEQTKVHRLRLTLKILITILTLLLTSELFFNDLSISTLALVIFSSIITLVFFLSWTSPDTCSVISGMLLWSVAVFITYTCWLGNGIFDANVLAFPCLLILAIVLSGKLIFISLFVYLIIALCLFALAHKQGLLTGEQFVEPLPLWGQVLSYIIILTFFSVEVFYIFADIRKRFKNIIDKNASLELSISELSKLSRYDQLTLFPNENVCKADLEKILQQQTSTSQILAFITVNISNQDSIKMNYSHSLCDDTLILLAKKLNPYANENTIIYRFQQNEFVILKRSADYRGISFFTEKIYQVCSQTFHVADFDIALHPIIGIALAPFDGSSMEELRHSSHLAMHTKVEGKKVNFSFFDQVMAAKEQEKSQLTKALRNAIVNNEFVLHFQPQVNLVTEQIIGAEALIRWISPEYGIVPPTVFIPLAEQAGVITDITHWVIEHSIKACQQWHTLGFNKLCIAVNLSAEDFKRGNLATYCMSILHQANLAAHFLELELTESMLMDDIHHIQKQINELRALGISFSIDDFGTGYSNLSYLTKFNVSIIKLDRSFVMNLRHSSSELQIVKAIIEMSKSLSITNVAEGIEDNETAKILTELGCEVGQGYLWSKPLPQEDFITLLSKENK
ncbi:MAG: EAL domain-containing protein (putative c-di-GMP-specific phosphodiesterase class I) [Alteromonadaceae bacterium]|jgi:EAL domain-containing protein (putative c-di-GMP-specific phosphodiesterase class I)/GGDEF domain-containing protein